MKIGFWLADYGGSPLQCGLDRGLQQLGHTVTYQCEPSCDLVLVFNMCAHNPAYQYPDTFPAPEMPIAFVDTAEYGYFRRLPGVIRDYANAFAPGSITHDTKNEAQQTRLRQWMEGRSFPYFLRELSVYVDWPDTYHPIDYPLYWLSDDTREPDREDYLRRDLDLFVFWGASHPWRWPITEALRNAHTRCEVSVIEEVVNGQKTPRMPQGWYFERTRAAKTSVSFDGYGSGSFRMTEVLVRTLLLQGPLTIHTREPLVDGVTCRTYRVESDGETFLSTNVADVLHAALADPEGSFEIYQRGYHHCRERLSERATAQYLLDVVAAHDWRRPTPLTV